MTSNPRAVLDTNVLISAALSLQGAPRGALLHIARHGVMLASRETLNEFATRIRRPKFGPYLSAERREEYIAWIAARAEFVEITERIRVCRDATDDKFLELAVNGRADVILTGDADLTALHPFRGIPIITPDEFLASLV
jgi:putative PIN family toxin of toxin-antitoxin system